MVFLSQKVDGNMIFTDYRKVLVLIYLEIRNTVFSWAKKFIERWYLLITEKVLFWTFRWWKIRYFFESRSWWKDDIYWILRSFCFELFGNGKYGPFFSQKVDGKMIFTWSFWAFYDIPGPGKYGFSRSAPGAPAYSILQNITGKLSLTWSSFICWRFSLVFNSLIILVLM